MGADSSCVLRLVQCTFPSLSFPSTENIACTSQPRQCSIPSWRTEPSVPINLNFQQVRMEIHSTSWLLPHLIAQNGLKLPAVEPHSLEQLHENLMETSTPPPPPPMVLLWYFHPAGCQDITPTASLLNAVPGTVHSIFDAFRLKLILPPCLNHPITLISTCYSIL